jgi:hypothetical protein
MLPAAFAAPEIHLRLVALFFAETRYWGTVEIRYKALRIDTDFVENQNIM